jgi:hypothetical protein
MGNKVYEKDEQAKWAKAVEDSAASYLKAVDEGLDKDAARGLCAPCGDTMMMVLDTAHEAKGKIVEAVGEIFQKQNERIIQMDEVDTKLMLAEVKLEMEYVRAQLVNLLDIETAQMESKVSMEKADIERRQSQIEMRQAALITMKADLEHEVNIYKKQAIAAEGITLDARVMLAQAQLETATEKLKIIDAIYEQIAAEELVLVAEQRKAAALAVVIEAERRLVAIKQDMIPMQFAKAEAREEQADAITAEASWNTKIVKLGYDKNSLVESQETAEEKIREAENDYHTAQLAYTRAQEATNIMRHYSHVKMKQTATSIRHDAIDANLALETQRTDLKFGKEVWQLEKEYQINFMERVAHLKQLAITAKDQEKTTRAEATKAQTRLNTHEWGRRIKKGSIGGLVAPGGTTGTTGTSLTDAPEIDSDVENL